MLGNLALLYSLVNDNSYEKKISGFLYILQDVKWRKLFGILKANILYMFENEYQHQYPLLLFFIEDCLIELSDDNKTGQQFSFFVKYKTTGKVIKLAALNAASLSQWVSFLTICSVDYMLATKSSLHQAMDKAKVIIGKTDEKTNAKDCEQDLSLAKND